MPRNNTKQQQAYLSKRCDIVFESCLVKSPEFKEIFDDVSQKYNSLAINSISELERLFLSFMPYQGDFPWLQRIYNGFPSFAQMIRDMSSVYKIPVSCLWHKLDPARPQDETFSVVEMQECLWEDDNEHVNVRIRINTGTRKDVIEAQFRKVLEAAQSPMWRNRKNNEAEREYAAPHSQRRMTLNALNQIKAWLLYERGNSHSEIGAQLFASNGDPVSASKRAVKRGCEIAMGIPFAPSKKADRVAAHYDEPLPCHSCEKADSCSESDACPWLNDWMARAGGSMIKRIGRNDSFVKDDYRIKVVTPTK